MAFAGLLLHDVAVVIILTSMFRVYNGLVAGIFNVNFTVCLLVFSGDTDSHISCAGCAQAEFFLLLRMNFLRPSQWSKLWYVTNFIQGSFSVLNILKIHFRKKDISVGSSFCITEVMKLSSRYDTFS